MGVTIHFMMATTLSMIMTLILYCSLEGTRVNDSLYQNIYLDTWRDYMFLIRCPLDNWEAIDTCVLRLYNVFCAEWYIAFSIGLFFRICVWQYGEIVRKYVEYGFYLLRHVWIIVRLCIGLNLWYQVDVFTIYFLVWQFTFIYFKWLSHELPWFSFRLQQGLLCFDSSYCALMMHELVFCYFPFYLKIAFLWFYSVSDCFTCLHFYVREYEKLPDEILAVSPSPGCSMFAPNRFYFYKDYENIKLDINSNISLMGLGDFLFYNAMILFVLPPLSSIELKICIGVGCIIFIQIDYMITKWNGFFWNENKCKPVLPLPVIAFSAYTILLNVFIEDSNSNLC